MLVHVVCWKYKAGVAEAQREDHRSRLKALATLIPDTISFDVGDDILQLDRSFHTGLVAVFPDRPALDAYSEHPDHQVVVEFGKEISEQVVSVDFLK
jgi:hypothetical protein